MTDFRTAYHRVERLIEDRYGVPVSVGDVVDPNTGDFDGARIQVDFDQDLESAFFVLVHLFGHTVQWNVAPELRALGLDSSPGKTDAQLQAIHAYEKDATRYSLRLMHDAGVRDLDQWLSDWWWADWQFLRHFYRTGERLDVKALWREGAGERLTPLDIPAFTPTQWESRWSF